MWDLVNRPNPNLGGPVGDAVPVYLVGDYDADMGTLPEGLELSSRVHVETMVGQMPGGTPLDIVDETSWVCSQLAPVAEAHPFGVVAFVQMARDVSETERFLREHDEASAGRLCGVRMILNHHPDNPTLTWPQVESGDLMRAGAFRESLALLAERRLAFDLSCHPHQVHDAVAVLAQVPDLRVVINHLGFLHDGGDEQHEDLWRRSLQELASLPNSSMKLSMLWLASAGYHTDTDKTDRMGDYVAETIDTFGCDRCMFASNYPVDKAMGIDIATLYGQFLEWSADRTTAERTALFHDTARRAYDLSR